MQDMQEWIDELIDERTVLVRRVRGLKRKEKNQTQELGVLYHRLYVVLSLVRDFIMCYYV